MSRQDPPLRDGHRTGRDGVNAEQFQRKASGNDVDDAVQRAHLVKGHRLRWDTVHPALRLGEHREDSLGSGLGAREGSLLE